MKRLRDARRVVKSALDGAPAEQRQSLSHAAEALEGLCRSVADFLGESHEVEPMRPTVVGGRPRLRVRREEPVGAGA